MPRSSLLCPNCRLLISASESRCPFCGLKSPAAGWRRLVAPRWFSDPVRLVKTVVGLNIAMLALALILDPPTAGMHFNPLLLLAPSDQSLLVLGATGTIPIDRFHRWWTLLSANYLHSGIVHIFFNMAAFRQLSAVVLREYGNSRTIVIYTLGGVCGFALSYLAGVPLTVGASAGVCGLVGAILYYGKSRGGHYGLALYKQVGLWVLIMFGFGVLVPGINNWGHGGGIAGGIVCGFLLGYGERRQETFAHRGLAFACMAATGLILAWAAVTALYYRFLSPF